MFNDFIADEALLELPRVGARFTWTNHQINPIRSVLDHVLISPEWDVLFPHASLCALPYVSSDHSPLLLASEDLLARTSKPFRFDSSWLLVEGFIPLLNENIISLFSSIRRSFVPLDDWRHCSRLLR